MFFEGSLDYEKVEDNSLSESYKAEGRPFYGYGEQYSYEDQQIPVYPGRNRSQASSAAVVPQMEEDSSRRNAIGDPIATSTPVENRRTSKEPYSKPDNLLPMRLLCVYEVSSLKI